MEDPARRFDELVARYIGAPAVSEGTGFGSNPGLRTHGKIFAMLVRNELVVKLPKARVDELVAAEAGRRFDPGHGRVMKEWLTVSPQADLDWSELAAEALAFVGG
jgi:YjbR